MSEKSDEPVGVKIIDEGKEGPTFRYLTEQCGSHCGAIASVGANVHHVTVGHCGCPECRCPLTKFALVAD